MSSSKIAVLKGDGIGPEVVPSARSIIETACYVAGSKIELVDLPIGMEAYQKNGRTLPPDTLKTMEECDGFLLGPLQTGSYPPDDKDRPMSSGRIRKHFDLFANIRPVKSLVPSSNFPDIDLVIVRENTEGFFPNINLYKGYGEFWTDKDTVISLRVIRRSSCQRIVKTAFEIAKSRNKKKLVSAVHKSNVLVEGDGLFLEEARRVQNENFPQIKLEEKLVDATAMELVMTPEEFDVIVTTNLFGDILSDECAGLVGGLGICPSLNSGESYAMAQAVHGTAPRLAGKGIANPTSEILSSAMLLDWLGVRKNEPRLTNAARLIEAALSSQLSSKDPEDKTRDAGGSANILEFTERLRRNILQTS
jgi:3-isopropylmalate dehydrogenase